MKKILLAILLILSLSLATEAMGNCPRERPKPKRMAETGTTQVLHSAPMKRLLREKRKPLPRTVLRSRTLVQIPKAVGVRFTAPTATDNLNAKSNL